MSCYACGCLSDSLVAGPDTATTKNQTAPANVGYYYAMDPVTGTYRLYQTDGSSLPPIRETGDSQAYDPSRGSSYGNQWFQVYSTTGLSPDGKTLFLQYWVEKETKPAQFDPKTGIPTQPRKFGIQEVIREMSTEKPKMHFFNGEGNAISKADAGKLLKENKNVVLMYGTNPQPGYCQSSVRTLSLLRLINKGVSPY